MISWLAQAVTLFALLATWGLWALLFVGWGGAILRPMKADPAQPRNLFYALWLGVASAVAALQLWHLVAPIDARAAAALFLVGLPHGLLIGVRCARQLRRLPRRDIIAAAALAIPLMLWIANRAAGPEYFYDAGLYHRQLLQWTERFAIVPGLANLHFRLGFNSGVTLLAAAMDNGPWRGQVGHLVNGFFLAAFALQWVRALLRVLCRASTQTADWFTLFLSLALFDWALDVQASSLSADLAAALITLAAGIAFVEMHAQQPKRRTLLAMVTIALASLAVACKGSCVPLSGLLIVLTLWAAPRGAPPRGTMVAAIVAIALLPGVWVVNNIIATGYPLYPSESLALPVDWRVPRDHVLWLRLVIRDWNRWDSYDSTAGHWRWLQPWVIKHLLPPDMLYKTLVPLTLALMAFAFVPFRRKAPPAPARARPMAALGAAALVAAAVWLVTGPAPRFAAQLFHLLMAAAFCAAFLPRFDSPGTRRGALACVLALALAPLLTAMLFQTTPQGWLGTLWIPPPPGASMSHITSGLHALPFASPALETQTTESGLQIQVPTDGDRAWDTPLPSTPASVFNPALRLRGAPGDFSRGFTVENPHP